MSNTRKPAQHAASETSLNYHQPALRPNRNHFSSPSTFFSNSLRLPRRNIGYPHLPMEARRGIK